MNYKFIFDETVKNNSFIFDFLGSKIKTSLVFMRGIPSEKKYILTVFDKNFSCKIKIKATDL